jgi:hypothetical protein
MRLPPSTRRARLQQDEASTAAAEALASCCAVADPTLPGCPLCHVSVGFEALSGFGAADLVGRSCLKVLRLSSSAEASSGPVEVEGGQCDQQTNEDGTPCESDEPAAAACSTSTLPVGMLLAALESHSSYSTTITSRSTSSSSSSSTIVGPEEATLIRKDGKAVRLLVCLIPILNAAGALFRWLLVACDCEDKAQRAAVESAAAGATADEPFAARWGEQLQALLTAHLIADGAAAAAEAAVTSGSGEVCPVVAASGAALRLTGFGAEELVGHSCLCLAGPDTAGADGFR